MDESRLRLMTVLALYDQTDGRRDRRVMDFDRRDYVYRKNLISRLLVFLAYLIGLGSYLFYGVFARSDFLETLNVTRLAIIAGLVLAALLTGYTLLGRRLYRRQYDRAAERQAVYEKMLRVLEMGGKGRGETAAHTEQKHSGL